MCPGWTIWKSGGTSFKQARSARDIADATTECTWQTRIGDLEGCLQLCASVPRETLFDQPGLMCIRRAIEGGRYYFIANRGDEDDRRLDSARDRAKSVVILDPLSGRTGVARIARTELPTGRRFFSSSRPANRSFCDARDSEGERHGLGLRDAGGKPDELHGEWQVKFVKADPNCPPHLRNERLAFVDGLGDTNAQRFAGTARYSITFDAPTGDAKEWQLDLGKVCQSARVRLNGRDLGTIITPPFRVAVDKLKRKDNLLEVEVTNVSANRIRDLDRRGVKWKTFHDINFVNLNYQPFNASNWPLTDSGLLGPVTLTPMKVAAMK